jgi:hypothetical protein
MRRRGFGYGTVLWLVVLAVGLCVVCSAEAWAQDSGSPASGAGVVVDAQGVLRMQTYADPTGMLTRQRVAAARASLAPEVAKSSKMRYVSLNRLETAIRNRQGIPTDEMRYLAGLLRVQYVFCYPDSGDVVIAGPAEGWVTDLSGRVRGISSGRPIVLLEDLVVALRAYPPEGRGTGLIGCSIDPTPEGTVAANEFLRRIGSHFTVNDTPRIVQGLQASVGLQEVSVNGVSPKTHFAQEMVEADYRMKLIGIGLETPPIRLVSYVERSGATSGGNSALQRWYFVPDYECVRASEDGLAMELVGDGVKLVGASEVTMPDGQRRQATTTNRASTAFVNEFTRKYSALAERSPVFAALRNLIDMAVAAAYIQEEGFYHKAKWSMEFFGNEESFAVETCTAPKTAATAVNALWRGNQLTLPHGGGVTVYPTMALRSENLLPDERGEIEKLREKVELDLAEGQWWWD